MTRKRSILAGFTDYTGYSMGDIIAHLRDWKRNTEEVRELLRRHLEAVQNNLDRLDSPGDIESYIRFFLDLYGRFQDDFERLLKELPNGVRSRHVQIVTQIYDGSRRADRLCRGFKEDHIERVLKDESLRYSLIDQIYGDTREMLSDYRDLANLAHRLKTFVEEGTQAASEGVLDGLDLKPNLWGIGVDVKHWIKKALNWFKARKRIQE